MTSPFTVSWFSANSEDDDANGTLVTFTFTVKENANTGTYPITVSYDPENVFDSTFNNIEFAVDNGYVEVIDYISGDINGDNTINMKDIVLLQQYLNDWDVTIDEDAANLNGDNTINMKDIVLLQQYLNDWDVTLS